MHVYLSSVLGALYSGMDMKCSSKTHVSKAWYPVQQCPEALGKQSDHKGSDFINRFNPLMISKLKGPWGDSGIVGRGGECLKEEGHWSMLLKYLPPSPPFLSFSLFLFLFLSCLFYSFFLFLPLSPVPQKALPHASCHGISPSPHHPEAMNSGWLR